MIVEGIPEGCCSKLTVRSRQVRGQLEHELCLTPEIYNSRVFELLTEHLKLKQVGRLEDLGCGILLVSLPDSFLFSDSV